MSEKPAGSHRRASEASAASCSEREREALESKGSDSATAPASAAASAPAAQAPKGRVGIYRVRGKVRLVVFLLVVIGLFAGVGLGSLSSFGIGDIAYLCPLGALEALVAAKTGVPHLVIMVVVMVVVVALLGRAFCSWVCPVPPVRSFFHYRKKHTAEDGGEASAHAGEASASAAGEGGESIAVAAGEGDAVAGKLAVSAFASDDASSAAASSACAACGHEGSCALSPVGGARDGFHLDSRHGVLAGALVGSAIFGFPVFCLVCPVGLSIATVVAVWQLIFAQSPSWSLLVFPLIVLVEVVFFRKWCHKICPLGALMSLLGVKSLFRPKVDGNACLRTSGIDCRKCVTACPEQLDPHAGLLPECTKCGACTDQCPAHAISMKPLARKQSGSSRR